MPVVPTKATSRLRNGRGIVQRCCPFFCFYGLSSGATAFAFGSHRKESVESRIWIGKIFSYSIKVLLGPITRFVKGRTSTKQQHKHRKSIHNEVSSFNLLHLVSEQAKWQHAKFATSGPIIIAIAWSDVLSVTCPCTKNVTSTMSSSTSLKKAVNSSALLVRPSERRLR